jgi:coenzyme Q-binding protein COQ10
MFDLVADVARYPRIPALGGATRVRSDSETEMVADLVVGFKRAQGEVHLEGHKKRPRRDRVDYIEGPLKYLHNSWTFEPTEGRNRRHFCVDFAFKNRIFEALAGQMFDRALRKMIGAFEEARAESFTAGSSGSSSSSAQSAA